MGFVKERDYFLCTRKSVFVQKFERNFCCLRIYCQRVISFNQKKTKKKYEVIIKFCTYRGMHNLHDPLINSRRVSTISNGFP